MLYESKSTEVPKTSQRQATYLPLQIPNTPSELRSRLRLLQWSGRYDCEDLANSLFFEDLPPSKDETASWIEFATDGSFDIDDFDIAQLFTHFVMTKLHESNSEEIKPLRSVLLAETDFGPSAASELRKMPLSSIQELGRVGLPEVRSKLGFKELIVALTGSYELMFDLIATSHNYLRSPFVQTQIHYFRWASRFGSRDDKKAAEGFFADFDRALQGGDGRQKKRRYPYWGIDHFFREVSGGIKNYARLKKQSPASADDSLRELGQKWRIPETYLKLIRQNPKSEASLTLGIMGELQLIEGDGTWKNVVKPYVDKIRKRHGYIRELDPAVRLLLDLPMMHPDLIANFDIWAHLESADFYYITGDPTELDRLR